MVLSIGVIKLKLQHSQRKIIPIAAFVVGLEGVAADNDRCTISEVVLKAPRIRLTAVLLITVKTSARCEDINFDHQKEFERHRS